MKAGDQPTDSVPTRSLGEATKTVTSSMALVLRSNALKSSALVENGVNWSSCVQQDLSWVWRIIVRLRDLHGISITTSGPLLG